MVFERWKGWHEFNRRLAEETTNRIIERLKRSPIWGKKMQDKEVQDGFRKVFQPWFERTVGALFSFKLYKKMISDGKDEEEIIEQLASKNAERYAKEMDTQKAYKFYEKALKKMKKKK